jgi:hypothetical protein
MPPKSLLKFDPRIIYIFKIFPATMATHQCNRQKQADFML